MKKNERWTVVDLFSGAGGMSYGFHAHDEFKIIGAADAQVGKPSSGKGALDCNRTYEQNIGIVPQEVDLGLVSPDELFKSFGSVSPTVLIACSPCTGFSRTLASNHLVDDPRNSLVVKTGGFVESFTPTIFLMENARELLKGNHTHHFDLLREKLESLGYEVSAESHFLNEFGLPQRRERAIVIAVKKSIPLRTLGDIWENYCVSKAATHVRHAIEKFPPIMAGCEHPSDRFHVSPSFTPPTLKRLQTVPKDGGSWVDLREQPDAEVLLTPAMKRFIAQGKFGSHPDVYGRMWWDRPAPTIKRECGHTGNGRYAHPSQDRLCTVRELAVLQGFPNDFVFAGKSLSNMYRHIGDAVPPLVAFQIACVCSWMLGGKHPSIEDVILPKTHLGETDIESYAGQQKLSFARG